jgi:hypothetical protein
VKKTVRIRLSFEIDVEVPRCWDDKDVEWHFGSESSNCCCLENIAAYMQCEGPKEHECLCDMAECEVVSDAN